MKIICVGRNYAEHAAELNNEVPDEPVLFMKPDSAILQNKKPFYIPDFSEDIHYELELVVRIRKIGKNIAERFAHRYYDEVGLGIDFTARDIQQKLKTKGLPWERAKAFDFSAALGDFVPVEGKDSCENLNLVLLKNGEEVQNGNTKDMLFGVNKLIAEISKVFTLKIGDLIYTGTPSGVGRVTEGDLLEGYLNGEKLLEIPIK